MHTSQFLGHVSSHMTLIIVISSYAFKSKYLVAKFPSTFNHIYLIIAR